jgi:hypothetical protein
MLFESDRGPHEDGRFSLRTGREKIRTAAQKMSRLPLKGQKRRRSNWGELRISRKVEKQMDI